MISQRTLTYVVSAITSPARTSAKVYYQSGYQSGPMAAMLGGVDIGSPSTIFDPR